MAPLHGEVGEALDQSGVTHGLKAQYFDNLDFTALLVTRIDASVGFDWGAGSPAAGIGVDTFSARWTGWLVAPVSETFTLFTRSDDGVRLWLDGRLVIDHWNDHSAMEDQTTLALKAGVPAQVRLEYYERGGAATMQLSWSSPSVVKAVIPPSALTPLGGVIVSSPLAIKSVAVQTGSPVTGTVSYQNTGDTAVTLSKIIITSRRPGATHVGGPYDDLAPSPTAVTLQPGATVTVTASRTIAPTDPAGTWELYSTYEDSAGGWHDAAPSRSVAVSAPPQASPCWPFTTSSTSVLRASGQKVFAHYFSPYAISLDNADPTVDYYARNYLQPSGEGGKFAFCGGFIKQRPLPQPPRAAGTDFELLNLQEEIRRAVAVGIDGFTYDMLSTSGRHWDTLLKLLEAAKTTDAGFRVVLMPDMTSTFAGTDTEARASFIAAIGAVAAHPSLYRAEDGRVVIAPFYPDARSAAWWAGTLAALETQKGVKTALVPTFVSPWVPGTDALKASVPLYGTSSWGPRTLAGGQSLLSAAAAAHARGLKWMAPVAPQDSRPKDLIYTEANNSQTLRALWSSAIGGGADWVQLITWNDYSEATEFSPSSGTQWAIYDLTAYYVQWFKSGAAPAITRDALYYFHRTMSTTASPDLSKQSAPYRVVNGAAAVNEIELLAMLTAPATLEIEVNGVTRRQDVAAGMQSFRVPLVEGTPLFRIVRNGQRVVSTASDTTISNAISYQDMLYRSGGSLSCDRAPFSR